MKSSHTAVSLLLTNLRLLDYDNDSEEFFPITPDVFTSLKNKGKAFEHIVYHLLHTLDPEECDIRLEGCWPIYEPAQSRELRNVVFKWLTDLKKSGQIGGNILVRRTLLDDCSGDRYEELLLSLSTTVLREQIEKGNFQDANHKTFAYKQTSSLTPSLGALRALILAHQSSLTRLLFTRRLSKSQWSSFNSFLDSKEAQISTLSESLAQPTPEKSSKVLSRGYEDEILRKWRNNWLGDQRWLNILLSGDPEHMRDRFFELSFEKALAKHHHFKNGLVGAVNGEVSLRALEKQVQEQKSRLKELQQMRETTLRAGPNLDLSASPGAGAETEPRIEKKDLRVVFDQHQRLHTGQLKIVNNYMANQKNEYTELMHSLREDLAAAGIPSRREATAPSGYWFKPPPSDPPTQNGELESIENSMEADSMDIDPIELNEDNELPEPELPMSEYSRYDYDSDQEMIQPSSPFREQYDLPSNPLIKVPQQTREYDPHPTTSDGSYPDDDDEGFSAFEGESKTIPDLPFSRADPQPPTQHKPPAQHSLEFGDDELLAERIVSTMTATAFSPEKPSPVKRMQHRQYQEPLDDTFDMDESTLRLSIYQQSTLYGHSEASSFSFLPGQSLLTPLRHPSPDRTRKEDLLVSSDYDSVFKSRPKIAVSPPFTPTGGSLDTLPGLSLVSGMQTPEGVFSRDDMIDFSSKHALSPLTKKDGKRVKM